jgi:hypothetical protein
MNTDCLARLYDRLTPRERLALIVAASARGDEADRARLLASAPTGLFRVPDYYGLAEGLRTLALFHVAEMLDLAARCWHASGMQAQEHDFKGRAGQAQRARWLDAERLLAYLLVVNADGWRRFCSEMRVDGDRLLKELPGYETLTRVEEVGRIMAFTSEEAAAWARQANGESAEALTSDAVVASLREFLDRQAERWR